MALALNIDELLGAARRAPEAPQSEAGAVHSNGMVDLAGLITRTAPVRAKGVRTILAAPKSRPIS